MFMSLPRVSVRKGRRDKPGDKSVDNLSSAVILRPEVRRCPFSAAMLPVGGQAGTRQACQGYRDIMTTTSDPAAYFGRQVRKERTARGWNLHEFGQLIAYHPAAISRVETGKRPPTESVADQC